MGRSILAALAASVAMAAPSATLGSDRSDVIAVVRAFNDAATTEAYQALCTPDAVVVDHVPPFVFQGPSACADEWLAVLAWAKQENVSIDTLVQTLDAPAFFSSVGDRAYAVFPVTASFRQSGRPELERLYATFVLRRQGRAWRIAQVTWTSLGWAPVAARKVR